MAEIDTDVLVVGGGVGGVAAALAAARRGLRVVLTEQYRWLGGQLTSQAVPPDEHNWVEQFGVTRSYRELRNGIRQYYREHYPLTPRARAWAALNPGGGAVSRLCHEPRVAVAVIESLLAPHRSSGRLRVWQPYEPVAATTDGDRVNSVTLRHLLSGEERQVTAGYVLDATETGDLLPLTGCEYVTGFESSAQTGEPHAPDQPQPQNMQAVSVCFAVDQVKGDHVIDRPDGYEEWRRFQPASWTTPLFSWTSPSPRTGEPEQRVFTPNPDDDPLAVHDDLAQEGGDLNLWVFRRIAARRNFVPGTYGSDITLANWPMIDYVGGAVFDTPDAADHVRRARELSLSFLYWMQTEAPRSDGGTGFPDLRLRGDVTGTEDGLAMAPYIRESRRIGAQCTIVEQDLSLAVRGDRGAVSYPDSVGIGMYRIDLHPSTGGDPYIDVGASPFQIPLGALLPRRLSNLVAAAKNIGTTHITNGCYRLHPVEWNIGEVAGALAAHCLATGRVPEQVRAVPAHLETFQRQLRADGVELAWPRVAGY
ncbi:MAG TPA: FAD-dependent oxidoreductase [Microlunatus sp.]|nr:FAD-dependent oxidoreductase [Microlunatus sp.]